MLRSAWAVAIFWGESLAKTLFLLVRALFYQDKDEEAHRILKQAITTAQEEGVSCLFNLGSVLYHDQKWGKAQEVLNEAIVKGLANPDLAEAQEFLRKIQLRK